MRRCTPDPASLILLLLGLLPVLLADEFLGQLPAPENVKIHSYNLEKELRWDPVRVLDDRPTTYTAQYNFADDDDEYTDLCVNVTQTLCDFTEEVRDTWKVILRVQAQQGDLTSNWVQTPVFQATKNTILGPVTSLTLSAYKEEHYSLYVTFQDPLRRQHRWTVCYNLSYWMKGSDQKQTKPTFQTSTRLADLKPWTEYCVEVTVFTQDITGEKSETVCAQPTGPALTTGGSIALFVSVAGLCIVIAGISYVMYEHHAIIKSWLYAPLQIPVHIQQYFEDHNDLDHEEESESKPAEANSDHVSVVEIEVLQESSHTFPEDSSLSEKT
ncbi:interferon gamma receptor 2 isoform X2 [Spea bombifrons]|uniref:interferon gamma receptor 2 isoform X2 n=1 Tax=Spea bombifrons TaxID=233779 RepID=UPI00234A9978|nr:interferon gamma receptor 2 isoform X2 [Spea bombifrons]